MLINLQQIQQTNFVTYANRYKEYLTLPYDFCDILGQMYYIGVAVGVNMLGIWTFAFPEFSDLASFR